MSDYVRVFALLKREPLYLHHKKGSQNSELPIFMKEKREPKTVVHLYNGFAQAKHRFNSCRDLQHAVQVILLEYKQRYGSLGKSSQVILP